MKRTLSAIMAFALGICSTPGVSTPVAESDARSANLYYSMTMDEDGNWKEVPEYKPFKQSEENHDEVSFYPYTFTKDGGSETVASVRLQPLLMDNMYYGASIDLGEGSGAVIASPVVTEVDMDFESSMLRAEVSSYDNKTELFSCCLLCPEDNASDKVKESEGPVEIKDGVTYYVLSRAYVAKDEPEEVTITDNGLTVNAYMEYYVSEAAINSFSKGDLLYFGMTSLDNNEQPSEMSALLPVRYGMKALTKTDYAVVTTDNVSINTDLKTEFTGSAVRPEVIVLGLEEPGVVLKKGEDYTASFSNNIHAGTARVTIAGVGDYYGNITAQFTVSPATITANNTEVSFAEEEYVYSGVAVTPEMSVVYRGEAGNITLNKGTDYSQVYSNNTAPGQAVVTINGTGDFTGSVEARFTITAPPEVYTVSFDANGGSGEMENVTVIEGNTFALPECSFTAPEKHEFDTWNLGMPGANVTITGNTTITALWKQLPPEEYIVSFSAGEGSGEMANVTVIEGNTYTLPECSFTAPEKYEFDAWDLGAPGANITITGNTTITALWKQLPPEVYTVSFDAGEGSGEMANVTVIEGNTYTLPECSFTAPEKYEFDTWDLGMPGANVTITGNTTITAIWKSSIDDNSSVIALNITNGYAGKFAQKNENATFHVDAPIQQFIGAVIATNFTNRYTNESGIIGSTIFDLRKTDNKAILDYLSNDTSMPKNESSVLYFNKESGNVVGVISYNNENNNALFINNTGAMLTNNTYVKNTDQIFEMWNAREHFKEVNESALISVPYLNLTQANVTSGSTIVTLTNEYLKTLEPGVYAIYFEFENGRAATLFAVENSTSVTPLPEEENGTESGSGNETENNTGSGSGNETENNTGSGSGNETENNTESGSGNETGNNTGSGSGNETGTESGTGNETETGNNTDSGNTGNERGENNAADTGSAGVIIYLMVAALLAGCVMSLSKGKKRRR